MVTIPVQVSDELARRLIPLQDRLSEIIELGLRQMELGSSSEMAVGDSKARVLAALASTGVVTLPDPAERLDPHVRRTPVPSGGQPASEMIIEQRGPL